MQQTGCKQLDLRHTYTHIHTHIHTHWYRSQLASN